MGSRFYFVASLFWLLVILTFSCWLPVLDQFSKTWVWPNWKNEIAEITSIQWRPHQNGFSVGTIRIEYQYKVAGVQYEDSISSISLCSPDTLAFYNKYRDNNTIVYYDPVRPEKSRAVEIALDYTGASLPTYGSAFFLGLTIITMFRVGTVYDAWRQSRMNERRRAVAARSAVKTPASILKRR